MGVCEMLTTLINVCMGIIAVGLAVFVFYPPPPPSPFLFQFETTGKYYMYGEHKIFYLLYENRDLIGGDTVVLFHGFPTSSYDYYKMIPKLKDKFKSVVLLDFIGFGFSDKPRDFEYSIKAQADIVQSLLSRLNCRSVHVISHDYGDTVAQELLARQIEDKSSQPKIKSLCLLNGGIFPETNKPFLFQKLLAMPIVGNVLSRLMNYRTFTLRMSDLFGPDTKPIEQETRDMWHLSVKNDGYLVAPSILGYISQRIENRDRWVGALQKTDIPVLMIYGPADLVNPPPFDQHFREVLPKAEIKVLDARIGHYPQLEDSNRVIRHYFEFYDKSWRS